MGGRAVSETFSTQAVISVGGQYHCCDFDELHRMATYMTGDEGLMTHQLIPALDLMIPEVRRQFPWLADLRYPPKDSGSDRILAWAAEMAERYGPTHEVEAALHEAWGVHDPIADLRRLAPGKPIIAVLGRPGDER